MRTDAGKVEHLYVHVPFCAAKCGYCAFYSTAGQAAKMEDYVDAMRMELGFVAANREGGQDGEGKKLSWLQPATIFFGGGTPSILPVRLLRRVLEHLQKILSLEHVCEWTIECNPATVSADKAKLFRDFGVSRISMGMQSLDDELLQKIGRVHSVKAAVESYEKLRVAGFDNINVDLMFGLPGQTLEQWCTTLRRALELQPEHISTYCLILEEDTHFWSLLQQGLIKPDEELELAMYEMGIEVLAGAGYEQYEVSNFARPGRECAHNIAYWEGEDYIGLGPSACSTVGHRRWQNVPDVEKYIEAVRSQQSAVSFEEQLTPQVRAAERAAFGMRMNAGVPAQFLKGRWDRQIAELLSAELVQWRNHRLQPTKRGILFADEIAAHFV
ncbi:MAG TPA: radical SAM family heme chaperone HemW [Verrucomicrobiae bacterium]|nr:radical SAM family heme chaperone HemW [Verrucomicrobiae bacterium]